MKIWIDLANSPQVLFFRPIVQELLQRGHKLTITTRDYAQTVALADQLGFEHVTVGHHGGTGLVNLIWQNYLRAWQLVGLAKSQVFDLAISHNSYSQAIAARILGIPMVTTMDYEHQPLNHLCFRLASKVIVPEVFPKELLKKYGAISKALYYAGVKEQIYLADFVPITNYRQEVGLPVEKPLVVLRPPADWTAYHRFENHLFDDLVQYLVKDTTCYVLFLPRIASQYDIVDRISGLHIATKVFDGPNLLYHADLVISGGGTMNREAAVLGTPTYTLFMGKRGAVDQYLIDQCRMTQIETLMDFGKIQIAINQLHQPKLDGVLLVNTVINHILGTT